MSGNNTEPMNDNLLSIRNLTVEYTSDKQIIHAVNNVSLDLKRGETLGLVGETGAGKTSIAKAILRILPDPPAKIKSGEILFNNKDIVKMKDAELLGIRGRQIAMIFQDPMTALNPTMRIGKQIAEGIKEHRNMSNHEAGKRALEMLKLVGIPEERFREYPHQFSGGMKQRVVIAIALSCNPDLLLADEPTTALDVTIQAQVLSMINELKEKQNTSMVLITHDLGIVAEMCDMVAVVYAGEIVEYGTRRELFKNASHPYTMGLFAALPDINSEVERLTPICGIPLDPSKLTAGCNFYSRCPYATEECSTAEIEMTSMGGAHLSRCLHAGNLKAAKKEVG